MKEIAYEPTEGENPKKNWPDQGAISIRNLSVRYANDLPDVLHNISFDIEVRGYMFCLIANESSLECELVLSGRLGLASLRSLSLSSVQWRHTPAASRSMV